MSALADPELRRFWKDIYFAAIKSGCGNYDACNRADGAVQHLIARAK